MKTTVRYPLVVRCGLAAAFTVAIWVQPTYAVEAQTASPTQTVNRDDVNNLPAARTPEILVTGTRIVQPNMVSSSPINMISDQEIKLQGSTQISDLLNQLPQQFQNSQIDFSSTSNPLSSPGGIATADLRGMGPTHTLVLVNGRRLGIGDANTGNNNPAPDLNQIPAQLVERVDVVTGGASAVYGSDAVAGVVNFIMKRDFEGVEVDAQYGFAQHTNDSGLMKSLLAAKDFPQPESDVLDGRNKEFSLLMGSNFNGGKANATVYFTYRDAGGVFQASRDFSACKVNATATTPSCSGSANSNEFINLADAANLDFAVVGNQFQPWDANATTNPPALFNSNPYQVLSAPDTRYTAGLIAHNEFNEMVDAYFEFSFMNDRAKTQIAPSALFEGGNNRGSGEYQVNCDNPLFSAQEFTAIGCGGLPAGSNVALLIGRRNIEGGGRSSEYEHQNYRAVFGLKGDLGQGWNYDAYLQYYYTSLYQKNDHYLSNAAVNNALQVVDVGGVPTCKSVVDGTDPNCVPYNIFTEGAVTADQLAYVDSFGIEYGTVEQKIMAANVNNDLGRYGLKSPLATDGLGIAVGLEYRMDTLSFQPDHASAVGDLSGSGGNVTAINDKSIHVLEEYIEARLPIMQDRRWAEDLEIQAGYRNSDYNLAGAVSTYKFGVQYAPVKDIRFRAIYNRAIRAPSIIELFNPQSVTNTSEVGVDPCAGTTPTATLAQCEHTGVTPAQYGTGAIVQCIASQCATLLGGNTALKPELADTYTFGFNFTPTFLDGLVGSVDYYKVKLTDGIGAIPISISLQNCLDTGDPTFCSLVHRSPAGLLFGTTTQGGYISGTATNIAQSSVSGIDIQFNYRQPLPAGMGTFLVGFNGTYLLTSTVVNLPGRPEYDCAGLFGATCQTLNPKWRHTLRLSWLTPLDVTASLQWRYIDSVDLDTNSSFSELNGNGTVPHNFFNASLPSMSYVDLSAIWEAGHGIAVRAGVSNLLDSDPPLVSSLISQTGSPNTYPTYDVLGRVFFMGATVKF